MRSLFAAVMLACGLSPAHAGLNAGLNQSFGTDDYEGTDVYAAVDLGGLSISPEFRRYSAKGVPSSVSALSLRLGYDTRYFGIGATAGAVPVAKGTNYGAYFGGADFAFTISPMGDTGIRRVGGPGRGGAPVGKGISRVDFGGGFLTTSHRTDYGAPTPLQKLSQTEMHGFVGASVLNWLLVSGRFSKFAYNERPQDRAALPSALWTPIVGHVPYRSGYADSSFHALFEMAAFPMVRPFADYTVTKYAKLAGGVRPGDTRAIGLGVRVGLELVGLEGRYQHINTTGAAKENNFVSVGASLRL